MSTRSLLIAFGLAVSAALPAQAAGSVYDLPSDIAVSNVTLHAGAVLDGFHVRSDDQMYATLPDIFSEASIRARDLGDGYGMGADVHTFPGGGIYAEPFGSSSLKPIEVSADGSWAVTLTNNGTQSRSIFGSITLGNRYSSGCCVSANVAFSLGSDLYNLTNPAFDQPYRAVVLAPGESVRMSVALNVVDSAAIGRGGDAEYNVSVSVFSEVSAVPEPSKVLLFGLGLAAVGGLARRRSS